MEYLLSRMLDYIAEQMSEISLVDEDYGQLENLDKTDEDMYPLTYPAVLVETSRVDWSHIQGNSQKGEAQLRVRLIIDCYDDTHVGSKTTYKVIEREELRARLHKLLHGYRPLDDGALFRTQSTFFTFSHGIKVYEDTYTCTVTEVIKKGTVGKHILPQLEVKKVSP